MSLLAIGASLLGGVLNNRSQSRTNSQNVELTKEQNALNRKLTRNQNRLDRRLVRRTNNENATLMRETNEQNIEFQRETNQQSKRLANTAIRRTVRDARKAGINPLTAVRGGGGGGGAVPTLISPQAQAHINQAPNPGQVPFQFTPAVKQAPTALGNAISEAGITLYNAYANAPDPEREQLEMALMREELSAMARNNSPNFERNMGYGPSVAPSVHNYSGHDTRNTRAREQTGSLSGGGGRESMSGPVAPDDISYDVSDFVTAPRINGEPIGVNPGIDDAEVWETRYADVGANLIGLGIMAADAWHHFGVTDRVSKGREAATNFLQDQQQKARERRAEWNEGRVMRQREEEAASDPFSGAGTFVENPFQ